MSDFDTVLSKLDNLEKGQAQLEDKMEKGQARLEDQVAKIGEAIWEQDKGLFARVAANTTARKIGTWVVSLVATGLVAVMIKVFVP